MKFAQPGYTMPLDGMLSASLQTWLGRELESRGIDAVVYTRYILSILQQDNFDLDIGEAEFFPPSKKGVSSAQSMGSALMSKAGPKGKKSDKKKCIVSNPDTYVERKKKSAAIECLLSVSDEDSGIESLVDELYSKLKSQKPDENLPEVTSDVTTNESVVSTSPDDPTERYYAAFPALRDKEEGSGTSDCIKKAWPRSPGSSDETDCSTLTNSMPNTATGFTKQSLSMLSHHQPKRVFPNGILTQGFVVQDALPDSSSNQSNSVNFRCGSQERVLPKLPQIARKKSWPDFDQYSQPSFIVPRIPMSTRVSSMTYADYQFKPPVCSVKITLQDIFGTDRMSTIEPCKTLVVDGQLVRLCATSVNSDNLEKTARVKFQEAPMEERVLMKIQQEVDELKQEVNEVNARREVDNDEAKKSVALRSNDTANSPDGSKDYSQENIEKAEDSSWYTDPMNQLLPHSPQLKAPLFRRNKNKQFYLDGNSMLSTLPTCISIWDDVFNDDSVFIGAQYQPSAFGISPQGTTHGGDDCDALSENSDYLDMTVTNHLLHALFDDSPNSNEQEILDEGTADANNDKSSDRLDVFKIIANDDSLPTCGCGVDIDRDETTPHVGENELLVSQYKGCLMPEITQNKIPDDRPELVTEHELNNNKAGEKLEVCSTLNNNCTTVPYLFPSVHNRFLSPYSMFLPGSSTIWSSDKFSPEFVDNHSEALFARGPAGKHANIFDIKPLWSDWVCMSSTDIPGLAVHGQQMSAWSFNIPDLSILCQPTTLVDATWSDASLDSPPKIWDINLSPRECTKTLDNISKYLMNMHLNQEIAPVRSEEFIVGGLYGGPLNSDDAWSTTKSDCSDDELNSESETVWNEGSKPNFYVSDSIDDFLDFNIHDDSMDEWKVSRLTSKLTGSMDLLHSETSAFTKHSLPSRLPNLMHVQSEPSISGNQWNECRYRQVEVKHLYKADTSILKTLGIDADEGDTDGEDIDYSPDHYFKPIQTPVNATATELPAPADDCFYDYQKVEDEETATLTDNYSYIADCLEDLSLLSSSSRSSNYQLYKGEETIDVTFIPRFKVFKEHKLIQTGDGEDDAMEQGLSERLLDDMKRVLMIEEEADCDNENSTFSITLKDLDCGLEASPIGASVNGDATGDVAWSSGLHGSAVSSPIPQAIANLWSNDASINTEVNVWGTQEQYAKSASQIIWENPEKLPQGPGQWVSTNQHSPIAKPLTNTGIWGSMGNVQLNPEMFQEANRNNEMASSVQNKWTHKGLYEEALLLLQIEQDAKCCLSSDLTNIDDADIGELSSPSTFIPDVLIRTPSTTHTMNPDSLPDVLLHDSVQQKLENLTAQGDFSETSDLGANGVSCFLPIAEQTCLVLSESDTIALFSWNRNLEEEEVFVENLDSKHCDSKLYDATDQHILSGSLCGDCCNWTPPTAQIDSKLHEEPHWLCNDDNLKSDWLHIDDRAKPEWLHNDDNFKSDWLHDEENMEPEWLHNDDSMESHDDSSENQSMMMFAMDAEQITREPVVHRKPISQSISANKQSTATNSQQTSYSTNMDISTRNNRRMCSPDGKNSLLTNKLEASNNLAVLSSELESTWLAESSDFAVQVPQMDRSDSGRKPCTYFMEGNCRRADCRFAHDTSQITCRFWRSGECFKGITCPFLHGFASTSDKSSTPKNKHDFLLEKQEFPELAKKSKVARQNFTTSMQASNRCVYSSDKSDHMASDRLTDGSSNFIKYKTLRSKLKQKSKSLPIDVTSKKKC